jgi:hypothetical protein
MLAANWNRYWKATPAQPRLAVGPAADVGRIERDLAHLGEFPLHVPPAFILEGRTLRARHAPMNHSTGDFTREFAGLVQAEE